MSPIPDGPYLPTSALVAVGWLGERVPGLTSAMVATRLPRDLTTWADVGFVKVTMIPGAIDVDIHVRRAMAQVDCYSVTVDASGGASAKPPVMKATRLAELITRATEDDVQRAQAGFGKPVTLPANYLPARVQAVWPLSDPVEIPDDPSGFGRVTLDLALDWVRI